MLTIASLPVGARYALPSSNTQERRASIDHDDRCDHWHPPDPRPPAGRAIGAAPAPAPRGAFPPPPQAPAAPRSVGGEPDFRPALHLKPPGRPPHCRGPPGTSLLAACCALARLA